MSRLLIGTYEEIKGIFKTLLTIDPYYTNAKISLRELSTWLSLTIAIKPRVWRNHGSYSRAILVAVSVKPRLEHWQTVQTKIRRCRTRRQIRVCTICLNDRKLRLKLNSLVSPFRTIFLAYTQGRSAHYQCVFISFIKYYFCYWEPQTFCLRTWNACPRKQWIRP